MIDKLEPDAVKMTDLISQEVVTVSIAISLKRIADAQEKIARCAIGGSISINNRGY